MDLYEYQARELLEEQGIPTPKAIFAQNSHEVAEAADQIGYPNVIKAQVKIGHRGQAGAIVSGGKGTAQDKKEALEAVGIRVGRTPGQTAEIMREVLASQSL